MRWPSENIALYDIPVDRLHNLVEARFAGFFTPEQSAEATIAVRDAVRSLGKAVGQHVTLYDVTDVQVASGATIEAMQRAFADPAAQHLAARKVAFCTGSALARIQAQRLRTARSDIGVFATRKEALAWLLAEDTKSDTPSVQ